MWTLLVAFDFLGLDHDGLGLGRRRGRDRDPILGREVGFERAPTPVRAVERVIQALR